MARTNGQKNKKVITRKLASNAGKFKTLGVRKLGLFGSVARNRANTKSDIDILVDFEPGHETYENLLDIYDLLKELLGGKIDLVTTGGLSPYIGPHILQEVEYVKGLS